MVPACSSSNIYCLEERDLQTAWLRDIFSRVVKAGLTSFFGSDRTRERIFVRFGEVDVFGKSLKRVVFFSFIFVFIAPTEHL